MIKLSNITIVFNQGTPLEHVIFYNLNLQIETGEFVTVVGGNGAGKSTLMNAISGDVEIHDGAIMLDSIPVTHWKTEKRAKLVSRVFQDPMLGTYADLTIEENLALALSRGKCRSLRWALNNKQREQFKERLAFIGIGLENRLKTRMGLLSGGQRQAVSLVMATMRSSKILLLDEHTAALDPKMEKVILELSQKLITEHKLTVLMITHCMSQALEYGNRTLVMHQGKVIHDLKGKARLDLQPSDLVPFF